MDISNNTSEEFFSALEDSVDLFQEPSLSVKETEQISLDNAQTPENNEKLVYQSAWSPQSKLHDKQVSDIILSLAQELDVSQLFQSKTWVLEFSSDGRYLAVGSEDGTIGVFETIVRRNGTSILGSTPIQHFLEHTDAITSMNFMRRNYYYLLSASACLLYTSPSPRDS